MSIELKQLVNDHKMVLCMNRAFSDLRADYELSIDVDKKRINELEQTNVDIDNHLQNLISYSSQSSGVVSGLRGTGKTHLMLLARNAINSSFIEDPNTGNFCVYVNAKKFTLPSNGSDLEVFNRAFSIFLYDELTVQLKGLLEELRDKTFWKKLVDLFDGNKRTMATNVEAAINKLLEFRSIIQVGTDEMRGVSAGTIAEETFSKEIYELAAALNATAASEGFKFSSNINEDLAQEISSKIVHSKDTLAYLNHNTVKQQLLKVMKLLGIRSLVFYVDEWEKLYHVKNLQKQVAHYINHIIDNPIFFWIGVVPNRGSLSPLAVGADLQHVIDLDESLIYEGSDIEKRKCIDYFTQFINKRLKYYFRNTQYADQIDCDVLFNRNMTKQDNAVGNLELLVIASMGNSRDFGTMLTQCWSEFQSYRRSGKHQGRPFKYISESMVIKAIQYSGNQKRQNISPNSSTKLVWDDITEFCLNKKSSHFVVEESKQCNQCMEQAEFSDLLYHRLLHFRKAHLSPKDSDKEQRLSLYALDYASIYDLHASSKKINYITAYDAINNSVRRYIYDPQEIVSKIKIMQGSIIPCSNCGNAIDVNQMKAAIEHNHCPYCGKNITSN